MNDNNRRRLEAGQRCRQWIVDNASVVSANAVMQAKCTSLTILVDSLETLAGQAVSAVGEAASATDVKGSAREDLLELMEKIRKAAKAAEPDFPGTQDRYRYKRNLPHEDLLAAGRSFQQGGATDDQLLQDHGAPLKWVNDVTSACNAFEASFGQQASAQGSQVAKNAEINDKIAQMMQLKRTISLLVDNLAAGDVGVIASWRSAAHVEEPPKTKKPIPPNP